MLIGNSLPELIIICFAILGLRSIAPLSIIYTVAIIFASKIPKLRHELINILGGYRLPLPLEVYLFAEAVFFIVVYLPLRIWLQSAASHPEPPDQEARKVLFQRINDSIFDLEHYLSGWFLGAPAKTIQRENVREFLAWSLLNKHAEQLDSAHAEEVEQYVKEIESNLGRGFKTAGAATRSLRTTFDDVPMQHRPLIWYLIVGVIDAGSHLRLLLNSFRFYRPSLSSTLAVFPPRLLALLGHSQKRSGHLSYWYRPHTSKTKLPIVFIHGIGIGLFAYVDYIVQLARQPDNDDGDVGIIVIEILPICSRICPPALRTDQMKEEIQHVLAEHQLRDFVLVGHSYGTAIAATILRDPVFSLNVKAAILLDPICFLLHLPDVAFNFTRRVPRRANERMLSYFSSTDMLISHTLARRFFWSEYILWKDDIRKDLPLTVVLSAKDLIVPTKEVWQYLTESSVQDESLVQSQLEGTLEWQKDNVEVIWFKNFDHAGLFSSKGARRGVAQLITKKC